MVNFIKGKIAKRKEKKPPVTVESLKKKLRRTRIAFGSALVAITFALFALVFSNFNYLLFKTLIAGNYIHTTTLDDMFEAHLGFVPDKYSRYFDNLVISVMTQAIREQGGDIYTYIYTPAQRQASRENIARRAATANFHPVTPDTVVLHLPNTAPPVRAFVMDNKEELATFDNIILDLRDNNGGELSVVQDIASLFLTQGDTISFDNTRISLFGRERQARRRHSGFFDFNQIIILQNGRTASSAEVLIAALTHNLDNIVTIGETTFGKATGQVTLPLRQGFAVRATVLTIHNPDMGHIDGIGIPPQVKYAGDDMLAHALKLLEEMTNE